MLLKCLLRAAPVLMAAALPRLTCAESKHQVYLWGNGVYQARPDALLQFQNFTPKRINNLPNGLVQLELGQYYEAGIDSQGTLFVWEAQTTDANLEGTEARDSQRANVTQLAKGIKEVKFTTGYIWTLTLKGEVVQYPIVKTFNQEREVTQLKLGKPRTVDPLKGSRQICAGEDHLLALSGSGEVWAMGDDTYGQCGNDSEQRATFPPFGERRVSYPVKVAHLKGIRKLAAGGNHCLALDEAGTLFGWGSNSNMQLSHEEEFSQMNSPLIASFKPLKISKGLDDSEILDIRAGREFSVVVSRNRLSDSFEVHTFGCNLKGQLGIGEIRHLRNVTKVEALSNFTLKRGGKQERVQVQQLACGNAHCIALLNIGYVMEWGDNEHGQMANKKRSPVYSPIIVRDFSQKDILGVFAGHNASGVILREPETKTEKK